MYDEKFMLIALEEAEKALNKNEIPVGAVIVKNDIVISKANNQREKLQNALAHAEILAINEACKKLNNWRLNECDIYITLEPCPMCAGAILNSRIKNIYFGAYDEKYGSCGSKINPMILSENYNPNIKGGYLISECENLINQFFKKIR